MVKINGFNTDVSLSGYLLITSHIDKPGIIGKVGTLLGNNNINIASMDVGRESIGGKAVMILSVDSTVPENIISQLEKIDGISKAQLVKI